MKVLVIGSTGRTGRLVVDELLHRGHLVTAFARSPGKLALRHGNLHILAGDVLAQGDVGDYSPGVNAGASTD
jgi:putative NADH-flavin reductase